MTSEGIDPPFITKTGKVLTDADIEALADEAEHGYVLCEDEGCPQAWAYKDPPREHYHPRPHGPEVPDG